MLNCITHVKSKKNHGMLKKLRLRKVIKPPQRLGHAYLIVFALISTSEVLDEGPRYYKKSVRSRNKTKWLKAMDEEMKSLHDNHTWEQIENLQELRYSVVSGFSMLRSELKK